MQSRWLSTVASAALIAGATFANAQTGAPAGGAAGGGAGSTMERGTGAGGGAGGAAVDSGTTQSREGRSAQEPSAPSKRTGQSRDAQPGQGRTPGQAQGKSQGPRGDQAQGEQRQAPTERQGAGQQDRQGAGQRNQAEQNRSGKGGRAQESTGTAPSKTSINTEQRTQIRQRLGHNTSARIDRSSVNFSLSVGVSVPRTVRLYSLPPEIVTIVPAYRGYKYVIVEDEIVIIDPRSWKIVYVIES